MTARGFTLAEMLVALFAFAVLSAAATSVLTFSLRSKEALAAADEELRRFQIARSVMKSDFGQIALRPVRGAYGGASGFSLAVVVEAPEGALLALVRRGWENPDGAEKRASLQYVEYALINDTLVRRSRDRLDPTPETAMRQRVLLTGVVRADVSFMDQDQWSETWLSAGALSGRAPQAVALDLELQGYGAVRQLFLVSGEAG